MKCSEGILPSLPESYRTVAVPKCGHWLRRFLAFSGPGYLVAVGYMDPGNWATDLAGGSTLGYSLLWVILLSNCIALLLQILSIRLGIVTGRDLAQACREHYSPQSAFLQWILCELAICAADFAEIIGMAISLKLLFGIPHIFGVMLTALDVLLVMAIQKFGFRYLEAIVVFLVGSIFSCFAFNLRIAHPDISSVALGFFPTREIFSNREMLYIAIGILGATVMPHNLYLHSSVVQTRQYVQDDRGKKGAIRYATLDIAIALFIAFMINAAILVTASAVFQYMGHQEVTQLEDAYSLLSPILGNTLASVLFGVALLAAGQSSAITATLAGQIVMEGFIQIRLPPWVRRLVTRGIALLPVILVTWFYGSEGMTRLLVFSQVILSLQLPFAIVPLIHFTSDRKKMGDFTNSRWVTRVAWSCFTLIVLLNGKLIYDVILTK